MKKIVVAILAFTVAGSVQAGERLEGDALKGFWEGKTIVGKHSKLGPVKTYHGTDGSVHSIVSSGKERKGIWWIDESSSKKCIEWNGDGVHRCHYTESNGDGTYTLVHGKKGKPIIQISTVLDGKQF